MVNGGYSKLLNGIKVKGISFSDIIMRSLHYIAKDIIYLYEYPLPLPLPLPPSSSPSLHPPPSLLLRYNCLRVQLLHIKHTFKFKNSVSVPFFERDRMVSIVVLTSRSTVASIMPLLTMAYYQVSGG